ncbi:hypothetical protein [Pseudomonas aeruginosa]|uniref:hypothetical protein n=1 Tax=Pseudomonas aeruginosa TaxID=287 RepID=UPI00071BD98F|nr:hypothetical protein [Pseudomonas aeruginosa]KSH81924.1 hypothetical protein AO974_03190 [Pseudomonas aeruginosa]KSH99274.1 hypothetical protein AO975_03315 [Pseudomonas aeruginosa]MBA5035774.1 hypothetical protein [Pseudomonas aeruginosa]HCE7949375.1 hypothetical protein [Pseudomonas aeruginosa]HCE9929315.1 hypothetical protein [Pseudomonas aeruginosa]
MSIDWNTAPEGATHWEPTGPDFYEGWMKKEGTDWFYWSKVSQTWFYDHTSCDVSAEREATFEARPQEAWDGQGLPPVGTNCEYRSSDGWLQCEVVAHRNNAAVVLDHHYEADFVPRQDLRPIRTPEQIAAEEREKAIEEMCFAEETLTVKQAKALYDAGYRRKESST